MTTPITYQGAFHFVDRANVANEYAYDTNGNLTKDLNKNIASISYNVLNLPGVVSFSDGNSISYGYDASGNKLSAAYKVGSTTAKTEYSGNKVYKNGTLSMILTEEGYITLSGTTPTYHYYLKDHQGNNRVVIDQSGTVEQVNHYYPFGGMFGEGLQTSNQPYKYNGKELDRLLGLEMYDYGARNYDAAIGRWWEPDPLAEKYYSISQYVYVANNSVRFIDPTGMFYDDYSINEKEKLIRIVKQNEKIDRVYDKDNPKGLEIEKGSFDIGEYRDDGYSIKTLTPAGMAMTDFVASNVVGGAILAKVGGLVGKGISAWRASRVAKAVETTTEVGTNAAKTGSTFFEGAKYSDKVLRQMGKADDLSHGFPKSVDGFATKFGQWSTKLGADGKPYQWLKMPGSYGGKTGVFEYTKDANGLINHRFFNVPKAP